MTLLKEHQEYIDAENSHTIVNLTNTEYFIILGTKVQERCKAYTFLGENHLGETKVMSLENYMLSSEEGMGTVYDEDIVTLLNNNYNNNSGKSVIDPSSGILLSVFDFSTTVIGWIYGKDEPYTDICVNWITKDVSCTSTNIYYNTEKLKAQLSVSCPPYTGPKLRCQLDNPEFPKVCNGLGKIISFSYIRQDIQKRFNDKFTPIGPPPALLFIIGVDYGKYAIIYDNTLPKETLNTQIFCTYDQDGGTGARYGDNKLPVGCNDDGGSSSSYNNNDPNMLINYINNTIVAPAYPSQSGMYNEVIIKSWVNNSKGSSNKGIGIADDVWGWNDALQHKPILAFGILVKGKDDASLNILYKTLQSYLGKTSYKIVGINTLDTSYAPFFSIPI